MQLGTRRLGQCSLTLTPFEPNPRVTELSSLKTQECHRNLGQANRLMDKICEEADEFNRVLVLMADDVEWLRAWYASHGFEVIQETPCLMARKPCTHFTKPNYID